MIDQDDDIEDEEQEVKTTISRKKMLIFTLPVLIVIGLSVGLYFAFNQDYNSPEASYSVVKKGSNGEENVTVFYDLPEMTAGLSAPGPDKQVLKLRLNLELSNVEDIPTLETLTPKINDIVLSHIIELAPEEVQGSSGLYWLKEELLYRINLVVAPIKISNLNIKSLDIEKESK